MLHIKIKDLIITALLLALAFSLSLVFHYVFEVREHITTVFVFAVFLVSLLTEGYCCGVAAAFLSTFVVNYAFTFPFFELNFSISVNLISGIIMIAIAILTGALTTKLKKHEANKANIEKERMRANLLRAVSHDLRTPLTTIYGCASTLIENGEQLNSEKRTEIVHAIKEDSEWLVRMVENLLSITKIDSGNVMIAKTPTVLEELIDSVVVKFKKRFPEQDIEIDLPDSTVMIPMDAILIEQVLINLLENACLHAKGMQHLSLTVFTLDGKAIFEIRDDGCGIPQKNLDTIFSGSITTYENDLSDGKKKNAGIGLSVCDAIIKAHGGSIKAENAKNGGAIFRFRLDTEEFTDEAE